MFTPHMAMKFLAKDHSTIITVKADPKEGRACYILILKVEPYVPFTSEANVGTSQIIVIKETPP